jgi:hypothetical protein
MNEKSSETLNSFEPRRSSVVVNIGWRKKLMMKDDDDEDGSHPFRFDIR